MVFWIAVTAIVGAVHVKTAICHKNYKEIVAFSVLFAGAVALALYVQINPAQLSLAKITMQMFHIG